MHSAPFGCVLFPPLGGADAGLGFLALDLFLLMPISSPSFMFSRSSFVNMWIILVISFPSFVLPTTEEYLLCPHISDSLIIFLSDVLSAFLGALAFSPSKKDWRFCLISSGSLAPILDSLIFSRVLFDFSELVTPSVPELENAMEARIMATTDAPKNSAMIT